jgi:hypothetical protein
LNSAQPVYRRRASWIDAKSARCTKAASANFSERVLKTSNKAIILHAVSLHCAKHITHVFLHQQCACERIMQLGSIKVQFKSNAYRLASDVGTLSQNHFPRTNRRLDCNREQQQSAVIQRNPPTRATNQPTVGRFPHLKNQS